MGVIFVPFFFVPQVLPEFNEKPPNVTITVHENDVTLSCKASGVPKPMVVWRFSGGHLPPNKQVKGDLTILSVQNNQSYEGVYSCIATNIAGSIKADVNLTIDGK